MPPEVEHYSTETMPHRRPHRTLARDDPDLNRQHYEASAITPSVDIGTYYPGCTQHELIELDHADEWADRFVGRWKAVSMTRATQELEDWLSKPPTRHSAAAIDRLRTALHEREWTPDLPIKMFNDFDRAFFGRWLKGMCKLRWKGSTKALYKAIGPNYRGTFGVTISNLDTAVPISKIILNAEKIFLGPLPPRVSSRKRGTFGTLLHEMVHGKFLVLLLRIGGGYCTSGKRLMGYILAYLTARCGYCHDVDEDEMGLDGGHGRHFQRCIEALERRTRQDIGYVPHWNEKRDHRGHGKPLELADVMRWLN